jgi:hypothetical protein
MSLVPKIISPNYNPPSRRQETSSGLGVETLLSLLLFNIFI